MDGIELNNYWVYRHNYKMVLRDLIKLYFYTKTPPDYYPEYDRVVIYDTDGDEYIRFYRVY
mgnify:CR=1 FL=1